MPSPGCESAYADPARIAQRWSFTFPMIHCGDAKFLGHRQRLAHRALPFGNKTVGHTGIDVMMGDLSILAAGLVMGVAIAWVLPGLSQLLPSVAARAAPLMEKAAVEKNELLAFLEIHEIARANRQYGAARLTNELLQELVERDKILWDKNPRLRDARGCDSPVGEHEFARSSQNVWWIDFLESKRLGASFTGLVSAATLQIAGANARSIIALTLLSVVSYWLVIDKPR